MHKTLAQIAREIEGRVVGDDALLVKGVAGLEDAEAGDLTFLANPKYLALAATTRASAIIVAPGVTIEGKTVIQTADPSLAFSRVVATIKADLTPRLKGVHPSAVIDPLAVIGEGAGIGPHVVIEAGARVGKGAVICAGCFIGQQTVLGDGCLLYPHVTVRENVVIGQRVIIHSGTVIGADGFGYLTVGDVHHKIPQMGTVEIGDDVEIGAGVTVDRARFDRTVIGRGTKIDNLVQVAHNVHIGENCLIIAQVGIAGSTRLGNNVILAGQVGVTGHIKVGDRAVVAAQSGLTKDVPAGAKIFGSPGKDYKTMARELAMVGRLPHYIERIAALEAKIKQWEEKTGAL